MSDTPQKPESSAVTQAVHSKLTHKPTTPDEGKTFDKNTIVVCVMDCYMNGRRWHKGDKMLVEKCPPFFKVEPIATSKVKS
jgi:hypothetical protein